VSKDKNHKPSLENPQLKQSVFQVPASYFDKLEGRVMDNIKAQDGALANNPHLKENIYQVPEGYFSQLQNSIENRIEAEEGALAQNKHLKEHIFKTPQGYFETLPAKVLNRLGEKPEAEVIPIYQRNWFRFVAAAVLILGVFMINSDIFTGHSDPLEPLSDELMLEYLYEKQDIAYELITLSEDFETIMDNILIEEASAFDFSSEANLELEYDFEYFEQ
jgi:hypothetical protein